MTKHNRLLFQLGQTVAPPGARQAMADANVRYSTLLYRHVTGDWGHLCDQDKKSNAAAVKHDDRIVSSYVIAPGVKVWVITEWDRSVTTLLLPEEY